MTPMPDLDDLLHKTSRTFALSIPLLPEPTRHQVTVAYLLFRIADTFEDAAIWPRELRIEALNAFGRLLRDPSPGQARSLAEQWREHAPSSHRGYLEVLGDTPFVMEHFLGLDPAAQAIVREHTLSTADLMAGFVARTDDAGELKLRDIPDLQEYCYAVAGIVGEMLTELFLLGHPQLSSIADYLRQRARAFGEGLQLTNILKDVAVDASEGRGFLPPAVDRSQVFELAGSALDAAAEYTLALQEAEAPRGVVAFNGLNLLLARATLTRVQEQGPGAKLTRPEVFAVLASINGALDRNQPIMLRPDSATDPSAREGPLSSLP
jgi:farnesyl-diphosphate farnesyltransferase